MDGLESPFVVLHPGASDLRRRWPTERFAAVGDALSAQGYHVLVTGTPPEQEIVEAVIERMRASAGNLCGRLSLGGLAGLLSLASVVITNDTGPMHLANAVGTRTVGIYWCGNAITAAPLTRARHHPLISWTIHCPKCGADMTALIPPENDCGHAVSFVAGVSVDDVLRAALALFGQRVSHQ